MLELNKIYNQDCLEFMASLPDKCVDMVLTDPPYGTTACKWDSVIPFEPMWSQLNRIIKDNGAIVLFGSQPFTSLLISSNLKGFKYCWVWDKRRPSNPMLAKKQCLKVHEDLIVFSNKPHNYYPQGVIETDGMPRGGVRPSKTELGFGKSIKEDYEQTKTGYPKSILTFGTDNTKNVHPTQKPVTLLEYLIKTYSLEGETVLDFTIGSGSTAVAAINTNRNFLGCELDKCYYDIACKRVEGLLCEAAWYSTTTLQH